MIALSYVVAPFSNMGIIFYQARYDFFCEHVDPFSGSVVRIKNACSYDVNGVTHKCTRFSYDNSFYQRTLVSQFDLVCDRSSFGSIAQSMHQLGYLVSSRRERGRQKTSALFMTF